MLRQALHQRRTAGPILLLALALAGCATPNTQDRVRSELLRAGVKPRVAGCMAERLTEKLSLVQLRKLGRAAQVSRRDVGTMTVDELIGRVRGIGDPEILAVVTRAGIGCWVAG